MMYINQNPFNLNELILSANSTATFQNSQNFNLLQQQQQQQQQQQTSINSFINTTVNSSNNRPTSVSSTGSSSSVSSITSPPSTQSTSSSLSPTGNKLTNDLYNPYNFASYYNTTLSSNTPTTTTNSTPTTTTTITSKSNTFALNTHLLNGSTLTTQNYNQINDKYLYRPNYQMNILSNKNNQFNFDSQASFLSKQNFYNSQYEQAIAYLPAATTTTAAATTAATDLFYTNTFDQSALSYLPTASFAYTTAPIISTKSLFNSKTPFTDTSIGINIKKRKRRFKKPIEFRKVLPKNSLMLLHEYRPNVEYRFVCQSGPIHRPIFTMCVEINEHKFEGEGKTKKEARMAAAEKAIEFLVQNPQYIQKSTSSQSSAETLADKNSINVTTSDNEDEDNENINDHDEDDEDECDDDTDKKKFKVDQQIISDKTESISIQINEKI